MSQNSDFKKWESCWISGSRKRAWSTVVRPHPLPGVGYPTRIKSGVVVVVVVVTMVTSIDAFKCNRLNETLQTDSKHDIVYTLSDIIHGMHYIEWL